MTTINDEIRIREGDTDQTYSKLYVNNDKELLFKDSNNVETNLLWGQDGYIRQLYTLSAAVSKSSSDTFVTYTIPANSLSVGSIITVLVSGQVTGYTSGSAFFRTYIDSFLLSDAETSTPANGWQFYGHGSATIYNTGVSGSVARGGMGVFGPQSTRSNTATCPVLVNGVNTMNTTSSIDVSVVCEITGTATLELRQFMIMIA